MKVLTFLIKVGLFLFFATLLIYILPRPSQYVIRKKCHFREYFIYHKVNCKEEISRIVTLRGDSKGGEPPKPDLRLTTGEYVGSVSDKYEFTAIDVINPSDFYVYVSVNREELDELKIGTNVYVYPMDGIPNEAVSMTHYE